MTRTCFSTVPPDFWPARTTDPIPVHDAPILPIENTESSSSVLSGNFTRSEPNSRPLSIHRRTSGPGLS